MQYEIKKSPSNTVIVEVGQRLDDTIKVGKTTLYIDPEFNPTHYARIYGRVVAVPEGSCYDESGKKINKVVEVGDTIYFHYLVTNDEANCIFGNYYRVPYYWIFCAVRDSRILPVGSWTLCEPVPAQKLDEIMVDGIKINAAISPTGIVTSVTKADSVDYAKLAYVGDPLCGDDPLEAQPGEIVLLEKNSNFLNKIEDKDYYTVKQKYILGVKMAI